MEAAFLSLSPELRDALVKVAMFVLVQALVYLILRNSSNVFSKDSKLRSLSFRPMRSMSVKRMLANLSDVPVGTDEPSTSSSLSSAAYAARPAMRTDMLSGQLGSLDILNYH
ncbi:hypothetical protein PR202_gb09995 [Eleusine coracana subsp. coracana]|uniref:Uncharacterized protein n=1 Tax=Eleusine coracana subsp. coracana TaxID=191504 RepID=A0AAV5EJJ6_ELECO|nr:hypothetical protein QOZ80_2BG0203100 [Eleusine coracana subsp. coracana]GJN22435.1 hypothetical protein PR202_gb09995 [Eleusine coracana subsp. coracana]